MVGESDDEIPELVRVFCLNHYCSGDDTCSAGFDYKAATELLWRHPEQVQHVTFEFQNKEQQIDRRWKNCAKYAKTGISFMYSPLRCACIETTKEDDAMEFLRAIRDIDPTQFLLQDSHGQLPIDGECVLNASLELLSFLLEIYLDYDFCCPNGDGMMDGNFNPITCLCGSYWWEDIQQAYEEIRSGARAVSGRNVLEDNLGIEDNFWKKIILLTKAFYHKTIQDEDDQGNNGTTSSNPSILRINNDYGDRRVEFRLLHACAGIDWFPPNLLRILVAAFPEALLEKDEDGNLPIHIASGSSFESYKTHDDNWGGDFEANSGYQKTTIDILLEANPNLAQISDSEGRLPLELALESGETCKARDNRWRPWEDGGIDSLLKAYPEAARFRSLVSGNLPLEVTLSMGSCRDWEDGVGALLRAYPEAAGMKNPKTGKYPLELAIEREIHFDDGIYGLLEVSPEVAWTSVKLNGTAMPIFAHAASEKCSASVVYKLLRTNPGACRSCFEKATNHNKRKQRRYLESGKRMTFSTPLDGVDDHLVSNKRRRLCQEIILEPWEPIQRDNTANYGIGKRFADTKECVYGTTPKYITGDIRTISTSRC